MKLSTDRILTTHVGSLPRPPEVLALLEARETGRDFDQSAFEARLNWDSWGATMRDVLTEMLGASPDSRRPELSR